MAELTPPEPPAAARMPMHRRIGRLFAQIDRLGVDGVINACGFLVFAAAEGLRALHPGKVQLALLAAMAVLVVTLVAVMLGLPNLFIGAEPAWRGAC